MRTQVDVLSRQAALAEVLQHRIADQEDVLQQLSTELEHVDAQRVSCAGSDARMLRPHRHARREQLAAVLRLSPGELCCVRHHYTGCRV